jgi:hypothetical protein
VTAGMNFPHEAGTAMGDPAEDEEGRANLEPVEKIENSVGVPFNTELAGIPALRGKMGAEVFDLEPVFNVDGYKDRSHV